MKNISKSKALELIDESISELKVALETNIYESDRFLWRAFRESKIRSDEIYENIMQASSAMGVVDEISIAYDEEYENLLLVYQTDDGYEEKARRTIILQPYYFINDATSFVTIRELVKSVYEGRPFSSRFIMRDSQKLRLEGKPPAQTMQNIDEKYIDDAVREMTDEE